MKKIKWKGFLLVAAVILAAAYAAYAANRMKLFFNGVVISNQVIILNGKAYAPVSDMARALNLRIAHTSRGYELSDSRGQGASSSETANSSNPEAVKQVPLTNLPAKAYTTANTIVVVNNEKAHYFSAPSVWLPLSDSNIQSALSGNWTPPMDINGVTYGSGYFVQDYNGGGVTLKYWLDHRGFTTLQTTLGLDDHTGVNNNNHAAVVNVSFLGDGRTLKTVQVNSSSSPVNVTVPIQGVRTLEIVTTDMSNSCECYPALDIVNPILTK